METDNNPLENSMLGFWARINGLIDRNDLDGFKNFMSQDFPYLEKSKYATAILFVGEHYDFLKYLIIDCDLKRKEIGKEELNAVSDKLFTMKELLDETKTNPRVNNNFKV